ncbi:mate-domain-containing protein [Catenaria anguillulae PL171]|uniref:Mate-domain-containing protein n=1 Tax=Catenaria anguillulae PL171 TaxID=765915 RepID=A0A1Y2H6Q4_9FUNG|nr:mate-domain-containing protein [Catenaria anguillulae PL171]
MTPPAAAPAADRSADKSDHDKNAESQPLLLPTSTSLSIPIDHTANPNPNPNLGTADLSTSTANALSLSPRNDGLHIHIPAASYNTQPRSASSSNRHHAHASARSASPARSLALSQMSVRRAQLTMKRFMIELRHTLRLSLPCVASYVLSYSNRMVVTFIVGHLGANELAASTLAVMFSNVLGFSICFGLSSALDTLASQAVTGSANPRQAGIYLQRAILINLLLAIPIAFIWLFAEPLLLIAGQDATLASMAGNYIKIMLFALVPNIVSNCVAKFLQAQGIMDAQFLVSLGVLPINVTLQLFLVYYDSPLRLGFYGAAVGSVVADFISAVGVMCYAAFWNGHQCWSPWTRAALSGWSQFLGLGIPGMLMICAEWWLFEIVALIAGLFGPQALAAQSVLLNTSSICYMFFLGVSVAAASRVGNFLGGGMPVRAKFATQVALLVALVIAAATSITMVVLRKDWARMFNGEQPVIDLVASVLPICAIFQFADGGVCVTGGVLRGCGKQSLGARLGLVSYYVIGLPLALFFTFTLNLGLAGLWLGLAVTQIMCYGVQVAYISKGLDWDAECRVAQERVNEVGGAVVLDEDDLEVEDEDAELLSDRA